MGWWMTAVITAILIVVAHHLGLIEKMAEVAAEVCKCARCCVFWGVLAVLLLTGVPLLIAAVCAIALAYLCDWFGLILNTLARLYLKLWERINVKKGKTNRKCHGN